MTRFPLRRFLFLSVFVVSCILPRSVTAESLEDAWEAALEADQRLQASGKRIDSAQKSVSAAKAALLPGLALESGYLFQDRQPAVKFSGEEQPTAQESSGSLKTTVTLPLFTSGRLRRGIDAAGAQLNAARAEELQAQLDLKMRVAEAYVEVLRSMRALDVTESQVASLIAHTNDVNSLFDQGLVARNDLLASKVALADARQQAIQARNRLDLARSAYNRLLGRPLTEPFDVEELSIPADPTALENLNARALSQRPELKVLKEQIQQLRHEAAGVRAGYGPQLSVSGGYSYQENRYQVHEGIWALNFGLKWNLFDSGSLHYQAGAIDERAEAVVRERADFVTLITLQVRQAWLEADETRRRLEVTREAVVQAEENLRVARDRYRAGVGTNTEVLDAETLRVRSRTNHDTALYDAALAAFRLRRAAGDL